MKGAAKEVLGALKQSLTSAELEVDTLVKLVKKTTEKKPRKPARHHT